MISFSKLYIILILFRYFLLLFFSAQSFVKEIHDLFLRSFLVDMVV